MSGFGQPDWDASSSDHLLQTENSLSTLMSLKTHMAFFPEILALKCQAAFLNKTKLHSGHYISH